MPYVNFKSLVQQIQAFRPLKQMAAETGISYSHLVNIKNGQRREPSYSVGARIIEYHRTAVAEKFDDLKDQIFSGWQV